MTLESLGAAVDASYGVVHVDVAVEQWVAAHERARDEFEFSYFDWLSAYDEQDEGFAVVTHLWSLVRREGVLVRTRVSRTQPRLASLTGVFKGANWHERETFEMFGIVFEGHPLLVPLLLPDGFEGHPLRKEFVLASRVGKEWPGAREPGEPAHGGPARRRMLPPGVPDYDEWGGEWR
jgi:NADH-quinone oxidoreductase subunit C